MVDILEFVSSFIWICFHAHHNEWLKRVINALSPWWWPAVVPGDNFLDDLIISLGCEREVSMIECIKNHSNVPKLSTLLNRRLITLFYLFWRKVLSMIILFFVEPFLLHVHEMPKVDNLANLLLLLRSNGTRSLRVLVSNHLHLLLIKETRVNNRLTRVCQWWLSNQNVWRFDIWVIDAMLVDHWQELNDLLYEGTDLNLIKTVFHEIFFIQRSTFNKLLQDVETLLIIEK
jgi:hypothetical protein